MVRSDFGHGGTDCRPAAGRRGGPGLRPGAPGVARFASRLLRSAASFLRPKNGGAPFFVCLKTCKPRGTSSKNDTQVDELVFLSEGGPFQHGHGPGYWIQDLFHISCRVNVAEVAWT